MRFFQATDCSIRVADSSPWLAGNGRTYRRWNLAEDSRLATPKPRCLSFQKRTLLLLFFPVAATRLEYIKNGGSHESKKLPGIVSIVGLPRGMHESSDRRRSTVWAA